MNVLKGDYIDGNYRLDSVDVVQWVFGNDFNAVQCRLVNPNTDEYVYVVFNGDEMFVSDIDTRSDNFDDVDNQVLDVLIDDVAVEYYIDEGNPNADWMLPGILVPALSDEWIVVWNLVEGIWLFYRAQGLIQD